MAINGVLDYMSEERRALVLLAGPLQWPSPLQRLRQAEAMPLSARFGSSENHVDKCNIKLTSSPLPKKYDLLITFGNCHHKTRDQRYLKVNFGRDSDNDDFISIEGAVDGVDISRIQHLGHSYPKCYSTIDSNGIYETFVYTPYISRQFHAVTTGAAHPQHFHLILRNNAGHSVDQSKEPAVYDSTN
uniref:Uncharacterized protein n=1 Tax=Oryza rufipogon TaxID=4529 RepID=A0A0E0RB97_ORYRU